jgi:hypothetical protein
MDEHPEAMVLKGHATSPANFAVCADCGLVSLFADDPEKLYAAFLKAQERRM